MQYLIFFLLNSSGTVTNVDEGVKWLSYSYLYVRMRKNPLVYGINYQEVRDDPTLLNKRREIIIDAARKLDKVNEYEIIILTLV